MRAAAVHAPAPARRARADDAGPRRARFPSRWRCIPRLSDLIVHGWDLARATGGDERLNPDTSAIVLEFLRPNDEVIEEYGNLRPEVDPPPGADAAVKLLCFAGRQALTWPTSPALLGEVVSPEHVLTGDAISDDYTHDEALTATPSARRSWSGPARPTEVAAIVARRRRAADPGHRARQRHRPVGRVRPARRRHRRVVRAHERDRRDRHREPRRGRAARRDARPARRGDARRTASSTRCSRASTAPASAATSPPTRAACAR